MVDEEKGVLSSRSPLFTPEVSYLVTQGITRLMMKEGSRIPLVDHSLYSYEVRVQLQRKIERGYKSCAEIIHKKSNSPHTVFCLSEEQKWYLQQGMVFVEAHLFDRARCDLTSLIEELDLTYGSFDLTGGESRCVYGKQVVQFADQRNYNLVLGVGTSSALSFHQYVRFMLPDQYYHGKIRKAETRCA